jgi:hypothetical protein
MALTRGGARTLALLAALALATGTVASADDPPGAGESASEIFKQRILPIFKSPKPSSCTECHLGAVDLKDYLSSDPAQTFASLRKEGLVDVKNPDESKILKLIQMKPDAASPITAELRQKEYEAFRAWIAEAAKDPALAAAEPKGKAAGPSAPVEVIRHARKDRLLSSFVENIWTERNRCVHCHAPGEPPNAKAAENKRNWVKKYGEATLFWLQGDKPEEAMDRLLASRIIDLKQPAKSLMLAKPTLQEKHEGGIKMKVGDRGYKQFLRFIEDYANIKEGRYKKEADLPAYVKLNQWLRVTGVPSAQFVQMQVEFHRVEGGRASPAPFAIALSGAGQGRWVGPVEALVKPESKEFEALQASKRLPEGTYQLRFYIDSKNLLSRNPNYRFGPQDLSGAMTVTVEGWPEEKRTDFKDQNEITAKEVTFPATGKRP